MIRSMYIFIGIALLLPACQGSKHFSKIATKQELAGLTTEAANNYYTALLKNRNNLNAQIGLKKTGQLVLNSLLNDFSKAKNMGTSKKEAVYLFHTARDYRDKIRYVGIDLQLPDMYVSDYESVKNDYLFELYDEGTSLLEEQKFNDAEARFSEITRLDPNYKDSGELTDIAIAEPLYRTGVDEMKQQHYRAAYENFQKINERKNNYKDTPDLIRQCLEKGKYTIAILPFENGTTTQGLDLKVSAYALEALTSINDPFLRIVDREHTQAILQEQKLQLSSIADGATAVKVGELVGANALLTGTVLGYAIVKGNLQSQQRDAYESFLVKKLNPGTGKYYNEIMYRPAKYTEYHNSSTGSVSFQYKLIALETGEIIKTEMVEKTVNDEIRYGKYDGDISKLFPMTQGNVNTNRQDQRALINLFSARQELRTPQELSNDLFNAVASQMTKQIGSRIKQIVP